MAESGRGVVQMENGPLARVLFNRDGTFEVEEILEKATSLGPPSLSDIGKLLVETPSRDEGGGSKNYARVDLT
jgi:hypothetical protein